jgi:restriction system protein
MPLPINGANSTCKPAVAFDARPVLGGKVVIQVRRYRDTVGICAVRDLFGIMLNGGASKGMLVCTSGYGVDAYNFSKDRPLELIDGGGLLYLLREHAGTHVLLSKWEPQ